MSIATLARKSRAQRGASTRTGWTLATTKSGNCPGPCGGGAPAKQHSFRLLMKNKQQGGGPNPGGTNNDASGGDCCFTTWKKTNDPKGEQSIGYYLWRKKQLTHNCINHVHWSLVSGSGYKRCQRRQYHEPAVLKVRFTGPQQAYFYHPDSPTPQQAVYIAGDYTWYNTPLAPISWWKHIETANGKGIEIAIQYRGPLAPAGGLSGTQWWMWSRYNSGAWFPIAHSMEGYLAPPWDCSGVGTGCNPAHGVNFYYPDKCKPCVACPLDCSGACMEGA